MLNCWEIKRCGNEDKCPAKREARLNGIHGGENGGRACWVVHGTFCDNEIQGSHAEKYKKCYECEAYKIVRKEATPNFQLAGSLLNKLKA